MARVFDRVAIPGDELIIGAQIPGPGVIAEFEPWYRGQILSIRTCEFIEQAVVRKRLAAVSAPDVSAKLKTVFSRHGPGKHREQRQRPEPNAVHRLLFSGGLLPYIFDDAPVEHPHDAPRVTHDPLIMRRDDERRIVLLIQTDEQLHQLVRRV